MKKTGLAYTAGIMDGEGSIGIARHKSKSCKRGYTLELNVQVTSSDEWLCQWLKFSFGGSLSHSINSANNPMWHWIIVARKARDFLELIRPYLRLKKPQADIAIQFQKAKRYGGNKTEGNQLTNLVAVIKKYRVKKHNSDIVLPNGEGE